MSEKIKQKKEKKPKSKTRKILEWVFTGIFALFAVTILIGQIDGMVHKNENYGQMVRLGFATFIVETDSMADDDGGMPVDSAIITQKAGPETIYNNWKSGSTIDITFHDSYPRGAYIDLKNPDNYKNVEDMQITKDYNIPSPARNRPMTHRIRYIFVNEEIEEGNGKYIFVVSGTNDQSQNWKKEQYQEFTEKQILGVVKVKSNFLGQVFRVISSPVGLLIFLMIPALYLVTTSVLDIFKAYKEDDAVTENASESEGETPSSENKLSSLDELSDEDRKRLKEEMLKEMLNKKGEHNE